MSLSNLFEYRLKVFKFDLSSAGHLNPDALPAKHFNSGFSFHNAHNNYNAGIIFKGNTVNA